MSLVKEPRSLCQGIQEAHGQEAKKTFDKGSKKAFTKGFKKLSSFGKGGKGGTKEESLAKKEWELDGRHKGRIIDKEGKGLEKKVTKENQRAKGSKKPLAKKPSRLSQRDPIPWPRSQEGLHQGIKEVLGQGAKKAFNKRSKALAKEPRRPSPKDLRSKETSPK